MNSVILSGALASDPEMRYTPNGNAVVNLRLAVGTGRQGREGKEFTDYFNIVAWKNLAEKVAKDFSKGDRMFVQGRIGNEKYTDRSGSTRWTTKVTASSIEKLAPLEGGDDATEAYNDPGDPD